jgi:hypothetical protein
MPKMFVILFGMELEPDPFFSGGNIDEITDALYHGPVIWQIHDTVIMVEVETQGVGPKVFVSRSAAFVSRPFVDLWSSAFISRSAPFKSLAFHDFAP